MESYNAILIKQGKTQRDIFEIERRDEYEAIEILNNKQLSGNEE